MKTLEQLYEEIQVDSELKKECVKATEDKKIVDFLKAHGSDATEAELEAFISSKKNNKELDDDELDMVSGGGACTTYNSDGWPFVYGINTCDHYVFMGDANFVDRGTCCSCKYVTDEGGICSVCKCPQRHESIDDI